MSASSVQVTLDKSRSIIFDFEALEYLETSLNGIPLLEVVSRLRGISIPTLTFAMCAGLRADDKTITVNLTRKIIKGCLERGMTYAELSEPVALAMEKSGIFRSSGDEPVGNEQTTASES